MKPALWWVRGVPVWPAPPCACHPVMLSKLPLSTAGGEDNVTGRVLPLKTSRQGNVDRSPQREDPRLGAASPAGASGRVRRPGRGRLTNTLSDEEHDGGGANHPGWSSGCDRVETHPTRLPKPAATE